MWAYIPPIDTSPCAPVAADWILPSNWRFRAAEQHVWWRGKLSPSRTWWMRCRKAGWLKRLFGQMPEPSTADAGVDMWMRSLGAFHARPIPSQDESSGGLTNATYGQRLDASSSSPGHALSSLKMSGVCSARGLTKSLARNGSGETYASWASALKAEYSARRKSARRTGGKGSSSSAFGAGGTPLPAQAANWSTPQARDHFPPHSTEYVAAKKAQGHGMANLNDQAANWQTPSIADTEGGRMTRSVARSNELLLKGQAEKLVGQWPTPTSLSFGEKPSAGQFEVDERDFALGLFPPGPDDFDAWAEIAEHVPELLPAYSRYDRFRIALGNAHAAAAGDREKAEAWLDPRGPYGLRAAVVQEIAQSSLRRVDDGLAANRIDWLRLLGNGVVPLCGALAVSTLYARALEASHASGVALSTGGQGDSSSAARPILVKGGDDD